MVPFPTGGVIAITDNLGKPVDPIILNPLPNENQINIDYLAINSNNIQSPLPATLTVNFGSAPLPINLISFLGKQFNKNVILSWKTTNETNFSHFELQKSENGKEFVAIGKINANESGFYNFTDYNPIEGINYYKLKMIDLDGTSSFSKTISMNFEKNSNYLSVENPAKNREILVRSNYVNPHFTLLNSLGQNLAISTTEMPDNQYKIKVKTNNGGVYFLMVESEGKAITRKVFIE